MHEFKGGGATNCACVKSVHARGSSLKLKLPQEKMINKKNVIREVLTFICLKIAYKTENKAGHCLQALSLVQNYSCASAGQWLIKIAYSIIPCL